MALQIQVLDHGYVKFVEAWGRGKAGSFREIRGGELCVDEDYEVGIIEAARQSTQKGFIGWDPMPCNCSHSHPVDSHNPRGVGVRVAHDSACDSVKNPGDRKLLEYLYNHKHDTPFEFAGMVIEVQAPIFVFREWHRHRTQSYNEMSARYAPLPDLYYEPDYQNVVDRARRAIETKNRQAQGTISNWDDENAGFWFEALIQTYDQCERVYRTALAKGIPKELARLVMPVGHYSRMRASANLRNWLAFMTLRCDPDAQWEIRQFAWAVAGCIERTFPHTYALWANYMNNINP